MLKALFLCILVGKISLIKCSKKATLGWRPTPMKNFDGNKVTGHWFTHARLIPCTKFHGSIEFTDITRDIQIKEDHFESIHTYRVGAICQKLKDKRIFKAGTNPAVHIIKDNIGNVYSGERVVVATDYTCFIITWGCLSYSQIEPKFCDDPAMTVMTRKLAPTPYTLKLIDAVLQHKFKTVMADLVKVEHGNPCE